jgi:hypothetical protein
MKKGLILVFLFAVSASVFAQSMESIVGPNPVFIPVYMDCTEENMTYLLTAQGGYGVLDLLQRFFGALADAERAGKLDVTRDGIYDEKDFITIARRSGSFVRVIYNAHIGYPFVAMAMPDGTLLYTDTVKSTALMSGAAKNWEDVKKYNVDVTNRWPWK